MNPKIKRIIRNHHLLFDSLIGQIFSRRETLKNISISPHNPIDSLKISRLRYSRIDHFKLFSPLPLHEMLSLAVCDLKVYQDALVYTFILDNLPFGSRLLEIGGGESRIVGELKNHYEIWNLDKLQGSGFGPKQIIDPKGFRFVKDYIGNFSPLLQDSYFDLIFSISTIEHFPMDDNFISKSIIDIQRLLKPGGYSLHCIDALLFDDHYFVHPFVSKVIEFGIVKSKEISYEEIKNDNNLWLIPSYAFYTRWFPLVKKTLRTFGHPFSINIFWQGK